MKNLGNSELIVKIKPLSVNNAWRGRRYKTDSYKKYEESVIRLLSPYEIPDGNLYLMLTFGFSSDLSDFDNPVKLFVDCLQKKYGFNDRRIKKCLISVEKTKKSEEFIKFSISKI